MYKNKYQDCFFSFDDSSNESYNMLLNKMREKTRLDDIVKKITKEGNESQIKEVVETNIVDFKILCEAIKNRIYEQEIESKIHNIVTEIVGRKMYLQYNDSSRYIELYEKNIKEIQQIPMYEYS